MTMATYLFLLGGVILGVTFLHEQLTWQVLAGALLIVSSLVITSQAPKQQKFNVEEQMISS